MTSELMFNGYTFSYMKYVSDICFSLCYVIQQKIVPSRYMVDISFSYMKHVLDICFSLCCGTQQKSVTSRYMVDIS